jgi:hypothetical protein
MDYIHIPAASLPSLPVSSWDYLRIFGLSHSLRADKPALLLMSVVALMPEETALVL